VRFVRFSLKTYIDEKIKNIGIIFNLDKHTQSGSHWVSMFIDIEKSSPIYKTVSNINIGSFKYVTDL
jgi:hypothetical protein